MLKQATGPFPAKYSNAFIRPTKPFREALDIYPVHLQIWKEVAVSLCGCKSREVENGLDSRAAVPLPWPVVAQQSTKAKRYYPGWRLQRETSLK